MLQLYAIQDKKTGAFHPPFHCKHVAEATRMVEQAVNDPKTSLAMYPADHALYMVGSFNEESGHLYPTAEVGPQFVIEVISLKKDVRNA